LHHSQKEVWTGEWESEFEFELIINEEFKRELRAFGSGVEVLKPAWLRKEFRKEANILSEIYATGK
jgi:predicted DNA-binding transcriptional regulator YafY